MQNARCTVPLDWDGVILRTERKEVDKTGQFRVAKHILIDWHNPSTGQDDRNQPHGKNTFLNV